MSTEGAFDVYRAVIHAVRADGKVEVRIPSLIGSAVVVLDAPDGGFDAPALGDVRMIAVSKDKSVFRWLTSASTPDLSDMDALLASHDDLLTSHDSRLDAIEALPPAMVEANAYTPTLYSMAVGTGGSATNTAIYRWVGGPDVADEGLLYVEGLVVFGTSGTTFPTSPAIGLPSGFHVSDAAPVVQRPCTCHFFISAVGFIQGNVQIQKSANDRVGIQYANVVGAVVGLGNISPTAPGTWAAGDAIRWSAQLPAVRV